jgi:hypothetical protein
MSKFIEDRQEGYSAAVYIITGVYARKYAENPPLPGPGGIANMGIIFIYLILMVVLLLLPYVKRKHRQSQIWLVGLVGELTGTLSSFFLLPFGIDFWAE